NSRCEVRLADEPAEEKAHEEEGSKPRRVRRAAGQRQAGPGNEEIFDGYRREHRGEHARTSPREPSGEGRRDVEPAHGQLEAQPCAPLSKPTGHQHACRCHAPRPERGPQHPHTVRNRLLAHKKHMPPVLSNTPCTSTDSARSSDRARSNRAY